MIDKIQELIINQKANLKIDSLSSTKKIPLQKGEVVQAKVLKSEAGGLARLLIRGREVTAKTSVHLQKGQTAFFKVSDLFPQPLLKYIEGNSAGQEAKSHLLATKASPYKMLADIMPTLKNQSQNVQLKGSDQLLKLWDLFNSFSIKANDSFSPSLLMSFIFKSGLLWESKLKTFLFSGNKTIKAQKSMVEQDIKALTLNILKNHDEIDKDLRTYLSKILNSIEELQLLNKTALEEKGRALFLLPMQFNDKFDFGQLFIDLSGKRRAEKNNEDGPLIVTLLLNMSNLGPVRADAVLFKKTVKVDIYVINEDVESRINSSMQLLKNQLEKHGFYLQQLNCYLKEDKDLEETSLIEELLKKEHNFSLFA